MRHFTNGRVSCSGFTVVELVVTCAIMAILAAIAIPGFSRWMPTYRLKQAVRELYSNLQQAKMVAIKQQGSCTVTYSIAPSHQYVVSGVTKTVILSDYGGQVRYAGPSSGFTTPNPPYSQAVITFNSRGMSDASPAGSYVYLSNLGETAYYRIGAFSAGTIKLERWNAEAGQFQN